MLAGGRICNGYETGQSERGMAQRRRSRSDGAPGREISSPGGASPSRKRRRIRPNVFARMARFAVRNALAVSLFAALFLAGAVALAILGFRPAFERLPAIALDARTLAAERQFRAVFPAVENTLVAKFAGSDPEAVRQAAQRLAGRLAGEDRLFEGVFIPGTGALGERNAIVFLDSAVIEGRVARARQLEPLFRALAVAPDLGGLASLVSQLSVAIRQGRSPSGLEGLLQAMTATIAGEIDGTLPVPLDWPAFAGLTVDEQAPLWFVVAAIRPGGAEEGQEAARRLGEEAVRSLPSVTLSWEMPPSAAPPPPPRDAGALLVPLMMAAVLVLALVAAGVEGPQMIVAALAMLAVSLATGFAASSLVPIAPDQTSWSFAPPAAALAAAQAVLVIVSYARARRAGLSDRPALLLAAQSRGRFIIAAGLAVPLLWAAWPVTQAAGMTLAAVSLAAAAAASTLAALIVAPALLTLLPLPAGPVERHWLDTLLTFRGTPGWRNLRQTAVLVLVAAAVFCGVFVPAVRTSTGALPGAAPAQGLPAATDALHVLVTPDAAEATIARLTTLPEVGTVRWIESYMPADIPRKRAALAGLAGIFPATTIALPRQSALGLQESIARMQQDLFSIANDPGTPQELATAATDLRRTIALFIGTAEATPERLLALERQFFASFADVHRVAERLAALPAPGLGDIDPAIARRFVAPDGGWRIEIVSKPGISGHVFASAVRQVAPNAYGRAVLSLTRDEAGRSAMSVAVAPGLILAAAVVLVALASLGRWLAVAVPAAMIFSLLAADAVSRGQDVSFTALGAVLAAAGAGLVAMMLVALRDPRSAEAGGQPVDPPLRIALLPIVLSFAAGAPFALSTIPVLAEYGRTTILAHGLVLGLTVVVTPQIRDWARRRPRAG